MGSALLLASEIFKRNRKDRYYLDILRTVHRLPYKVTRSSLHHSYNSSSHVEAVVHNDNDLDRMSAWSNRPRF